MTPAKTNAVRRLEQQGIAYELVPYRYDGDDLSVEAIAAGNGLPVNQIFKTLVAKGDKTGVLVTVVPGDAQLDFKALAQASGNKKAALVPVKEIQALTGYIRGGCSPVGMKKNYPVFLDRSALDHEYIYVNAGARGLLMRLHPEDLRMVTGAVLTDLAN